MDRIVEQKKIEDHHQSPEQELNEVISDARWFPLKFDVDREHFQFVFIPDSILRDAPFIRTVELGKLKSRIISYSAISDAAIDSYKLNLILHSSQGGSTLLTKALGEPGVVTPLQEPPILTDVIAYGLRRSPSEIQALLGHVTRLASRPYPGDEAVVCKVSHIGNGLSIQMAETHPASKMLCLDTPLEEMLSSYAAYGAEGRRAARKLHIGIKNSHMLAVAFPEEKYPEFIDLQLAALSWLSMRKMMLEAAAKLGAGRVRAISSRHLFETPRETLAAVAGHFGVQLDVEQRLASGIFDRHAKTGEPFNARQRAERTVERLKVHRDEIEPVVEWTRKVAQSTGVDWDLPYPLLD